MPEPDKSMARSSHFFFMASPPIGCVGIVHASQPGSEQSQHTEHGGTGVVVGVILESIPGLCQLLHDL